MSLRKAIAKEVEDGRLPATWTTADLRGNVGLSGAYKRTHLNTAPPNNSVSLPGLGLGTGVHAKIDRPQYWRVGRRDGTLVYSLNSNVNLSTDNDGPEPDSSGLEPIVETDLVSTASKADLNWTPTPLSKDALDVLKEFVVEIDKKRSWNDRLAGYFWKGKDFAATQGDLSQILWTGSVLSRLRSGWIASDESQALVWANEIFQWGGTRQRAPVTAAKVLAVLENAVSNRIIASPAPMNSGYTKVASFATDYLEHSGTGSPQAINDSRVATSLTWGLDSILQRRALAPSALFPDLGFVNVGRGGTRPRSLSLSWPNAYGSWRGQLAATQVVVAIRDILNGSPSEYPVDGYERWTVRMVEAVLFMDGY